MTEFEHIMQTNQAICFLVIFGAGSLFQGLVTIGFAIYAEVQRRKK